MNSTITRRSFVRAATGSCAAPSLGALGVLASPPPARAQSGKRPPPLDADLVHEFVKVAHGDLARTQELLGRQPALVVATWDWGGGDFETGLGGAAHMGNRPIAEFLLANGARIDLFAAAMLGRLDIVKAALAVYPGAIDVPGPHGIPLIAHASAGGEEARPVLEFLNGFKKRASEGDGAQ